jgi:hypothetical protein
MSLVRQNNNEDKRYIIKYTLGTFSTFVEVFENWSCKTYYTKYDASTTTFSLSELEVKAKEEALNLYAEEYYGVK